MRHFKRIMFMTLFVPALVLSAAACNDDDGDAESSSNASQESIDALSTRVERNEQMFAVIAFSKLGLHAMDEALTETSTIDPSYAPNTREMIRLLALTDWGTFQADADTLRGHAEALLTALSDEDVDAAAAAATEVHEGEHEFSHAVWNEIAKDLDPKLGGPEPEEEEESETPAADETPAAEATP